MKPKLDIIFIFVAVVGILLSLSYTASTEEAVVIIANKNVPASSLSIEEVNHIFLGKKGQWLHGLKIEIVILEGCSAQDVFLKSYLKKTSSQYDNYFKNLVFEGKNRAPRTFSTEAEVVSYVSSTEGAIGYVSSEANTLSTKVITVK